jgi:pyruvate-formate lyase-activating enzyme
MSKSSNRSQVRPRPLYADEEGRILEHPDLQLLCRKGDEMALPRPQELTPLPEGSDLFLLPQRRALGFDPETGEPVCLDGYAVAAFVCPGYTLTGLCAYVSEDEAEPLPLFAYGAVGFARGRFWVCAKQVDRNPRQQFGHIPAERIEQGAGKWLRELPDNRLVQHLGRCALTHGCPAAKNLALGRFEAPLPTSRSCNAACVGCISWQPEGSCIPVTQPRIEFTPSPEEIVAIMRRHAGSEPQPIFSFGQGCEGEPLLAAETIARAVRLYRSEGGKGTINLNTNGSLPSAVSPLARAGLDSVRVSLNSARPDRYSAYYRPRGYCASDVRAFLREAGQLGLYVSLNYLFFPGVSDTEEELEALRDLIAETGVDLIQMRNLNIDPELYLDLVPPPQTPSMGLINFRKRLRQSFPGLEFGYFNPFLDSERKPGFPDQS